MKHVVMFSGGLGSWATARRVAERHGTDDLVLLFADTLIEDEDLYRFLPEAAADAGGELITISEGRDVWQVFRDVKYIGNTRIDPCSRILKRELLRRWLEENCDPDQTTVYLGIDWTEEHRFTRSQGYWSPWSVDAPLCEAPYYMKGELVALAKERGIKPPRLYELGFPHNNCGGFCIKMGHAGFKRLLEVFPERYAEHERNEAEMRDRLGADVAILRDRTGGDTKPLTLEALRMRVEAGRTEQLDLFDWGGCDCFIPGEDAEDA